MFLTFNDLSTQIACIESEEDARSEINNFAKFCNRLSTTSAVDELFFPDTVFSTPLYQEYSISNWISDTRVPREHRQFLIRFFDKYKRFFNRENTDGDFSISIDGQKHTATCCAFALEHKFTLLSLPTNDIWISRTIQGDYTSLDEDGEAQTTQESVANIWSSMSKDEIAFIHRNNVYEGISSGQDLWDKREELYPNLIFCENTKKQLFIDSEKHHILAIMKKLNQFQQYFSSCDKTYDAKKLGMDARTESETVKKNPYLKKMREFRLPNGDEKYFFDHVGFTGKYDAGRIHFLPDNQHQRCYIGYIGKHLPTKKH